METPSTTRALLTVDELAAVLGVTSRTVYRLNREGAIPSYRVGGQFRFDADEVLAALRKDAA